MEHLVAEPDNRGTLTHIIRSVVMIRPIVERIILLSLFLYFTCFSSGLAHLKRHTLCTTLHGFIEASSHNVFMMTVNKSIRYVHRWPFQICRLHVPDDV